MLTDTSFQPTIDEEKLIKLASDLVRIESTSGAEGRVAEFLATYMESEGLAVELQEVERDAFDVSRYNVVASLRGGESGPRVLLTGHTDAVPPGSTGWTMPAYSGEVREGRLYGRGSADMKGGIASMVEAVCSLRRSQRQMSGEVILAFVVGEEVDQSGTRRLISDEHFGADFAYVGEPTELEPVVCHNGLVAIEIRVTGQSAHASRPDEGRNAIDGMHLVLDRLKKLRKTVRKRTHPLTGAANLAPGTIHGGEVSNMVPDHCILDLDRRLLPGESAEAALAEIEKLVENLRAVHDEFEYSTEAGLIEAPMETAAGHPAVTALRAAIEEVTGRDPGYRGWTATCDAGLLSTKGGIPTVVFGPGSLSQAHRPDEYVEVEQLCAAARIYAAATTRLLS